MSETDPAPDLEDARAHIVDVKERVEARRDRSELNLATSALDVALEVDGPTREWALRDCHHHVAAVRHRPHIKPEVTSGLRRTLDALEEVVES